MYSIGHGSRKWDDFVALLRLYGITYLIDVRSYPASRFHVQYNRAAMEQELAIAGICYVYMGDALGGRPKDKAFYNEEGRVDYSLLSQSTDYLRGIERLQTAVAKDVPAAIMCSERDPRHCHRARLIGATLLAGGISLQHIDVDGSVRRQEDLLL